jgi:hypothetical protein
METEYVLCKGETLFLYIKYVHEHNFSKARDMVQTDSRRPLNAEAQVQSQDGQCEICGGRSGTGTGFAPSNSVFRHHYSTTTTYLPSS